MYATEGLIDFGKIHIASKSIQMQGFICHILKNFRFVELYARTKVSKKHKLEKITDVTYIEKRSKTVVAGNFYLDLNKQKGEDFFKALEDESKDFELRTKPKHY